MWPEGPSKVSTNESATFQRFPSNDGDISVDSS
jgi:hypothetical protein